MRSIKMIAGTMVATASFCIPSAWSAGPMVFSGSGAEATTALDAYRTAIGGSRNTAGSGSKRPAGNQLGWCPSGWH